MIRTYPDTRIDEVTDTLAGVSFPDSYRWLEQESEELRRWQRAVENRWAVSANGTRIPYHLVRRADVNATQPRPTLIYASGTMPHSCHSSLARWRRPLPSAGCP